MSSRSKQPKQQFIACLVANVINGTRASATGEFVCSDVENADGVANNGRAEADASVSRTNVKRIVGWWTVLRWARRWQNAIYRRRRRCCPLAQYWWLQGAVVMCALKVGNYNAAPGAGRIVPTTLS